MQHVKNNFHCWNMFFLGLKNLSKGLLNKFLYFFTNEHILLGDL